MKPSKNLLLLSPLSSRTCSLGPGSTFTAPSFQMLTKYVFLSPPKPRWTQPAISLILQFLGNKFSLCSPNWPWIHNPLGSQKSSARPVNAAASWAGVLLPRLYTPHSSWICCYFLLGFVCCFWSSLWKHSARDVAGSRTWLFRILTLSLWRDMLSLLLPYVICLCLSREQNPGALPRTVWELGSFFLEFIILLVVST